MSFKDGQPFSRFDNEQDFDAWYARLCARTLKQERIESGAVSREAEQRIVERKRDALPRERQSGLDLGSSLVETLDRMAASFAGGLPTNRPPASPEDMREGGAVPMAPPEFSGGEDWLEGSVWVRWEKLVDTHGTVESCWADLQRALETAKEYAKGEAEGADAEGRDVFAWKGLDFLMRPKSVVTGGKGGTYRYVLEKDGITYMIANREEPCPQFANVRVSPSSLTLMQYGSDVVRDMILSDLDTLGGTVDRWIPSRIDIAADLAEVLVGEFYEKLDAGRLITRARNDRAYGEDGLEVHHQGRGEKRRVTSFYLWAKGAPLTLNVYDKLLEVTQKQDEQKLAVLIKHRWGGKLPTNATRVEFRLRREKLKELGVDTMEDWFRERANIIRYLCREWLRFTEGDVDRTNNAWTQTPVWSVWDAVERSLEMLFGGVGKIVKCVKKVRVDFKALQAQTVGTIASKVAYKYGVQSDKESFLAIAWHEFVECVESKSWPEFVKRQQRKRRRYEASNPARTINEPGPRAFDDFWNAAGGAHALA